LPQERVCVAYPATRFIPKALLDVGGKTLIERNIEIMWDQLNIELSSLRSQLECWNNGIME